MATFQLFRLSTFVQKPSRTCGAGSVLSSFTQDIFSSRAYQQDSSKADVKKTTDNAEEKIEAVKTNAIPKIMASYDDASLASQTESETKDASSISKGACRQDAEPLHERDRDDGAASISEDE